MFSASLSSGLLAVAGQGEIAECAELARGVPPNLIEDEQCMRRGRDRAADRLKVRLHGLGVGLRLMKGNSGRCGRPFNKGRPREGAWIY
jgi:hypothetical protein